VVKRALTFPDQDGRRRWSVPGQLTEADRSNGKARGRRVAVEETGATVATPTTRREFVEEISRLWNEAHDKFLAIGRYLIQAKQALPHGQYQPMIQRDLPFTPATARMIVTATQAIDSRRLPADRVPSSYSTVYLLTTLSDEERDEAERQGLIRPDVRRQEILAFKRDLAASSVDEGERLCVERERLQAEQKRILERLEQIEAAIAERARTVR
jgi:hypothetical protein